MYSHDFISRNWLRNYPLRGGQPCVAINGEQLPTQLLVGARLCGSLYDLRSAAVYVTRVTVKNRWVGVVVGITGLHDSVSVWYGSAEVLHDNTVIPMQLNSSGLLVQRVGHSTAFPGETPRGGGFIVVGSSELVAGMDSVWEFEPRACRLEDSCVIYTAAPRLHSLIVKGQEVTGSVGLTFGNIRSTQQPGPETTDWQLDVISTDQVTSRLDKTAVHGTCDTPVITGVNSVTPDGLGNIDIFGIAPVAVSTAGFGVTLTTPGLALAQVCPPENVPAYVASNSYIGSILTVQQPEWKVYWSQYQDP